MTLGTRIFVTGMVLCIGCGLIARSTERTEDIPELVAIPTTLGFLIGMVCLFSGAIVMVWE